MSVIVNDRPDVALLGGADGVHLGQTDLPCREVRRLVGRQLIIGVSTHEIAHAEQAKRDGADYCGVGPMFHTTTKHKDHIAGPAYLQRYLQWGKLPHLAIGGISPNNIDQLTAVDVQGVAVSSCVCSSEHPLQVVPHPDGKAVGHACPAASRMTVRSSCHMRISRCCAAKLRIADRAHGAMAARVNE